MAVAVRLSCGSHSRRTHADRAKGSGLRIIGSARRRPAYPCLLRARLCHRSCLRRQGVAGRVARPANRRQTSAARRAVASGGRAPALRPLAPYARHAPALLPGYGTFARRTLAAAFAAILPAYPLDRAAALPTIRQTAEPLADHPQ